MLGVTGFNEYNIKLNSVIGNNTIHIKIEGFFFPFSPNQTKHPGKGKVKVKLQTKGCHFAKCSEESQRVNPISDRCFPN